jgi:hypothetical protein
LPHNYFDEDELDIFVFLPLPSPFPFILAPEKRSNIGMER